MGNNRKQIIGALENGLKKCSFVFAFWLEGADAMGTVDKYSDIDIWLDVQDGREVNVIKKVRGILSRLAPLDFVHEINHPDPKICQIFFHLKGSSEFLIIDVCVQSHSRDMLFTRGHKDEAVKVVFDKAGVVRFCDLDQAEFKRKLKLRIDELRKTFLFFQAWVMKGVRRNNFLEALSYYHSFVLAPLVELLRIYYEPTKREFGLKHVERDLPRSGLKSLEDLYKVNSTVDISVKTKAANQLFLKMLKKLKLEGGESSQKVGQLKLESSDGENAAG